MPSVRSSFWPSVYSILLGAVTSTDSINFALTLTSNSFVKPSYDTVTVCFPVLSLSYPLIILSVIATSSLVPLSYLTVILPSARSSFWPSVYSILLGAVTSTDSIDFALTLTFISKHISESITFAKTEVLPSDIPVITPFLTVAMLSSLENQSTFVFVAVSGRIFILIVLVVPTTISAFWVSISAFSIGI